MTEPDAEPIGTCATCTVLRPNTEPHDQRHGRVCRSCREQVEQHLAAIPAAYVQLDAQPVRGTTDIRSRAFGSKPPLNLSDLSLLAAGWDTPMQLLESWAADFARLKGDPPLSRPAIRLDVPPGRDPLREHADWWVSVLVGRLVGALDWAFDQHPYIADFAGDMRRLAGQVRAHADDLDRRGFGLGPCPKVFRSDRCQRRLFLPPGATVAQCTKCGTSWPMPNGGAQRLWAAQADAGLRELLSEEATLHTVAAAQWLMDHYGGDFAARQAQLRQWAHRGHVPKPTDPDGAGYDNDGRALYRLADLRRAAEKMLGPLPERVLAS